MRPDTLFRVDYLGDASGTKRFVVTVLSGGMDLLCELIGHLAQIAPVEVIEG